MMIEDLPDQTKESHLRDMKILKELGFTQYHGHCSYQLSSCSPFPGTQFYAEMKSGLSKTRSISFQTRASSLSMRQFLLKQR